MSEKIVTLAEAKAHLSQLTDLAASGESVIITKHGKAVARISQASRERRPINLQQLRDLTATIPFQSEDSGSLLRRLRDDERY